MVARSVRVREVPSSNLGAPIKVLLRPMLEDVRNAPWVSVFGGHSATAEIYATAERVGELLARRGAVVVCGGLGGVMEAVAKGAKLAGGVVVGILPTESRADANPFVDIPIPTGLGVARNALVARCGDVAIAIDGKWGTLSEIALAKNLGKRVVVISSFELEGVEVAETPEEAVAKALEGLKAAQKP